MRNETVLDFETAPDHVVSKMTHWPVLVEFALFNCGEFCVVSSIFQYMIVFNEILHLMLLHTNFCLSTYIFILNNADVIILLYNHWLKFYCLLMLLEYLFNTFFREPFFWSNCFGVVRS